MHRYMLDQNYDRISLLLACNVFWIDLVLLFDMIKWVMKCIGLLPAHYHTTTTLSFCGSNVFEEVLQK